MTILPYLDNEIETFRQEKGDYPSKIIVNKATYDKIFSELEIRISEDDGGILKKEYYRGIPLEISEIDFIKLEG